MLDASGHAGLIALRPFLYHYVHHADDAKLDSILEHGLDRADTHYQGLWRSRVDHVYVGDMSRVKDIFFMSGKGKAADHPPWALLRIDTARLERQRINADEDHWLTENHPEQSRNRINGRHACQHFHKPFPPTQWIYDWATYLKIGPCPSLGEWADAVGLGDDPAEVRYSIAKGSIAYRGVVPPEALSLVHSTEGLRCV